MKTKLTLIAALYCGLTAAASAFTLDFIGQEGKTLPTDVLVINIAGYGDVQFEAIGDAEVSVGSEYENDGPGTTTSPSLNFDPGESVKVTFLGLTPINVDFDVVGENPGESLSASEIGAYPTNVFVVALSGNASDPANSGAGLYQISFDQVPEPSTAFLGLIGGVMLVLRRRR
ncbi:PEP-CTERM sorting domain-containing protein [Luteolibacter sp. AS25]|uniref:PEP-CTERM sorting domain-containing protein n=1 Tax=Luteolibacter sp. AS25 TaxID=3135776 RepID=UPI00398B78AF